MFLAIWFFVSCIVSTGYAKIHYNKFPKDFIFGVGTSSYQIEGAWNIDGKGPSIWDNFTHRVPSPISNNDTGDVACDHYHRYKEDIRNIYNIGFQFYRFSISWPRVLPTGYSKPINEKGISFYKKIINEILRYNMTPVVTIYHWDLPQRLYEDGIDWTNPKLVDIFVDYARIIISRFPEVGLWTTINEPKQICRLGYGTGILAPGVKSDGLLEYQCTYVILKTHAATYRMYKKEFSHYKAKMSIVIECPWSEPLTNTKSNKDASERLRQFECGMYMHPIYIGDWPKIVKDRIAQRSKSQNLTKSRLPSFTREEIAFIKGTQDYLGLNYYYTYLVSNIAAGEKGFTNYEYDMGAIISENPNWKFDKNLRKNTPWGIRRALKWIKGQYNNPVILITEMGVSDDGTTIQDDQRIEYYREYSCNILDAMYVDKVKVVGLGAWSLMDNFEWMLGYKSHFGLYYIDFYNDPSLKRVPKKSVQYFRQIIKSRELICNIYDTNFY
ncbi:unnamed protein product [Psylliodes chrysocephalus]|uniref:Beta-glucosidase n=1 Tax=Psylliodes chrysocephalus TaxID=3402493 RepID=A0A9P0CQF7_9CUCU|nr:unnamed protein product [Psylliodes chrysocephala]